MNITQVKDGKNLTLQIEGRIDSKTAPEMESVIREVIDGVEELTIDMKDTVYISSAGLRVLLIAQKQMNRQGNMKVIHVNEDIMEIFEVTGFADILTIA